MASSMTYLHVAIPLNISSFDHQLSLFSDYLTKFQALKTDQASQITFTKSIRDLAQFASSRLRSLRSQLAFIDSILPPTDIQLHPRHQRHIIQNFSLPSLFPSESEPPAPPPQSRPRRFVFLPSMLVCQRDLDIVRQDRDALLCERNQLVANIGTWRSALSDSNLQLHSCQSLLNTLNQSLYEYPDLPEFHDVYFNHTYNNPQPTTTTPAPFSAFRPVRRKRQILAAAALGIGAIGTLFGLFNHAELSKIRDQIIHLSDQHHLLATISKVHEHQLRELNLDLEHLTQIVQLLITYNPALVYAKLDVQLDTISNRLTVLFDTLQQLQHQRLSVRLLDSMQLATLHDLVVAAARTRNLQLLSPNPQDLFQLDTSYVRSGQDILILLHVPCVTSDHLLTIYRYIPFPYPLSPSIPFASSHRSPLSQIHTLQDLLHSNSSTFASSALFFVPETEMIAIGRSSPMGVSRFRLVSQADLSSCIQKNHIFLCDHHQILRKDLQGTCLGALYLQHEGGVKENCRIDRRPLRETVYQLSATDHLVYTPTPLTTQILCSNGSHYPLRLHDTSRLHVPESCLTELRNHTITSDGSIRIKADPLHFQWDFDPLLLPSELLSSAAHLDDELNTLKESLHALHNSTSSSPPTEQEIDQSFSTLLNNHMSSPSKVPIILWLLFSLFFAVLLLVLIWCLVSRHRRRRRASALGLAPIVRVSRRLRRTPSEDSISYIARTGIVVPEPAPRSGAAPRSS